MKKYVISIGREFCSGGREIGKMLAKELGIDYYDEENLREKSKELGIEEGVFEMFDEQPTRSFLFSIVMDPYAIDNALNSGKVLEAQRKVIEKAADEGPCVIVGRRADKILDNRDDINVVSIFIGADIEDRIDCYLKRTGDTQTKNLSRLMERKDRERASYYNYLGDGKWGFASNYTMCFSTSQLSKEAIVKIVKDYVENL